MNIFIQFFQNCIIFIIIILLYYLLLYSIAISLMSFHRSQSSKHLSKSKSSLNLKQSSSIILPNKSIQQYYNTCTQNQYLKSLKLPKQNISLQLTNPSSSYKHLNSLNNNKPSPCRYSSVSKHRQSNKSTHKASIISSYKIKSNYVLLNILLNNIKKQTKKDRIIKDNNILCNNKQNINQQNNGSATNKQINTIHQKHTDFEIENQIKNKIKNKYNNINLYKNDNIKKLDLNTINTSQRYSSLLNNQKHITNNHSNIINFPCNEKDIIYNHTNILNIPFNYQSNQRNRYDNSINSLKYVANYRKTEDPNKYNKLLGNKIYKQSKINTAINNTNTIYSGNKVKSIKKISSNVRSINSTSRQIILKPMCLSIENKIKQEDNIDSKYIDAWSTDLINKQINIQDINSLHFE